MLILLPIIHSALPHFVPYYSQCCSLLFHIMLTESHHNIHTEAKSLYLEKISDYLVGNFPYN